MKFCRYLVESIMHLFSYGKPLVKSESTQHSDGTREMEKQLYASNFSESLSLQPIPKGGCLASNWSASKRVRRRYLEPLLG